MGDEETHNLAEVQLIDQLAQVARARGIRRLKLDDIEIEMGPLPGEDGALDDDEPEVPKDVRYLHTGMKPPDITKRSGS